MHMHDRKTRAALQMHQQSTKAARDVAHMHQQSAIHDSDQKRLADQARTQADIHMHHHKTRAALQIHEQKTGAELQMNESSNRAAVHMNASRTAAMTGVAHIKQQAAVHDAKTRADCHVIDWSNRAALAMRESWTRADVQMNTSRVAGMIGATHVQQQGALHDTNSRSLTDQQRTQADMRMHDQKTRAALQIHGQKTGRLPNE